MKKIEFKFFLERLRNDVKFKKLSLEGIERNKTSTNLEDKKNLKPSPASNDYWTYYPGPVADTNDYMSSASLPLAVALDLIEI
jgi:hypothetical protein